MNRKHYNKVYYSQHKRKILYRMNSKVHCDICNTEVSKVNYPRHLRTTKHKKLLEAEQEHQQMLKTHMYKNILWNYAAEHGLLPHCHQFILDFIAKD